MDGDPKEGDGPDADAGESELSLPARQEAGEYHLIAFEHSQEIESGLPLNEQELRWIESRVPDAGERLLALLEEEAAFRRDQERKKLDHQFRRDAQMQDHDRAVSEGELALQQKGMHWSGVITLVGILGPIGLVAAGYDASAIAIAISVVIWRAWTWTYAARLRAKAGEEVGGETEIPTGRQLESVKGDESGS